MFVVVEVEICHTAGAVNGVNLQSDIRGMKTKVILLYYIITCYMYYVLVVVLLKTCSKTTKSDQKEHESFAYHKVL